MGSKRCNLLILLIGLLVTTYVEVDAYTCEKYKFDFNQEVVPGNIIISWSINTELNRFGEFQKEDNTKHSYVIVVSNLQGDVLLSDTIAQNWFEFNVFENEALAYVVGVDELYGDEYIDMLLKRKHYTFPEFNYRHSVGRTYPWRVASQQSSLPFQLNIAKFKSANYIKGISKNPTKLAENFAS